MMFRSLAALAVAGSLLLSCAEKPQAGDRVPPYDSGVDMRGDDTAGPDTSATADTTGAGGGERGEKIPDGPMGEKIGPLQIGMSGENVVKALGEPAGKTPFEEWGADGMEHQDWKYPGKGVTVGMVKTSGGGVVADRITLGGKSTLKTARKVGIGSTREEVKTAYLDDIDPESDPLDEERIVVGSLYGGIVFTMAEKKVTGIFVGAAAE